MRKARLVAGLEAHTRTLAAILSVLLFANTFIAVRDVVAPSGPPTASGSFVSEGEDAGDDPLVGSSASASATASAAKKKALTAATDVRKGRAGTVIPGKGTIPHGISGDKLKIVYYWKGDQAMSSSQFLHGTGQEGNVDEGEAFTHLINYINNNPRGELMGFRYNMHGWKLDPQIVISGKGDEQLAAARRIAGSIKPFAAVSSHGSVSAYVCPLLAKEKILNISTYDLDFDLTGRTGGMCLPQGLSFGAQVDLTIAYLKKHMQSPYRIGAVTQPRRYGLLYAEYPGLVDSGKKVEKMLIEAGINVVAKRTVDPDLTTAGRQQPGVVAAFRDAEVNTIIAPDSGSLITFTHAAQGAGFTPDYYLWPCSGADSTGMVRLYNGAQWARASGLTCYDKQLNADLTTDEYATTTQWYKAYQESAGNAEPPAPTALVYQSLLPLVVGITYAGRDLTLERFQQGLKSVRPYRYNAVTGRTTDPRNILVVTDAADGSQVGDAAYAVWDPSYKQSPDSAPGGYVFPENKRYRRGETF
jgi:hypothetical protein